MKKIKSILVIFIILLTSSMSMKAQECPIRCWNLGEVAGSGNTLYVLWHQCPWGHFTTVAIIPIDDYC